MSASSLWVRWPWSCPPLERGPVPPGHPDRAIRCVNEWRFVDKRQAIGGRAYIGTSTNRWYKPDIPLAPPAAAMDRPGPSAGHVDVEADVVRVEPEQQDVEPGVLAKH